MLGYSGSALNNPLLWSADVNVCIAPESGSRETPVFFPLVLER